MTYGDLGHIGNFPFGVWLWQVTNQARVGGITRVDKDPYTYSIRRAALVRHNCLCLPIARQVAIVWWEQHLEMDMVVDCFPVLSMKWLRVLITRAKIGEIGPIHGREWCIGR